MPFPRLRNLLPRLLAARKQSPQQNKARKRQRSPLSLEALEDRTVPSTFLVTSTADSGTGSLRQAILDANATPEENTITFDVNDGGVQTIRPTSALPAITRPVTIDGTTQPGFAGSPIIVLDGSNVSGNGLAISAGASTVRGLVIDNFKTGPGIELLTNGGNLLAGNYLGTDAAGTASAHNLFGLVLLDSSGNTIGGTSVSDRNVLAGNTSYGLYAQGNSNNNLIEGNYFGTDAAGGNVLGNSYDIRIDGSDNTVGGTAAGAGNVIAGAFNGVYVFSGTGNHIQGNNIGTDATGTKALGNTFGVLLWSLSSHTTVGGTAPGAGNLISGNTSYGLQLIGSDENLVQGNYIGTDATGTKALANGSLGVIVTNGSDNTIGGPGAGAGNLISGNTGDGIHLEASTGNGLGNVVQGNLIGTDVTGTKALGNAVGIYLNNMKDTLIGGTAAGAGNVISGNAGDGVFFFAGGDNQVQGNYIGTDATGATAVANHAGVHIGDASTDNLIGGTAAGAGNLISGNMIYGVEISASFGTGDPAAGNLVEGNTIGTDVTGSQAVGNFYGVFIMTDAHDNTVGGTDAGAGNLISGNRFYGIFIGGGGAAGNRVEGNLIGTDATGTTAVGNVSGVTITAPNTIIGGTTAATRNVISGNTSEGVFISNASGTVVEGNYIGTDVSGTQAVANGTAGNGDGVIVGDGATNTAIGGTAAGAGNVISGNHRFGLNLSLFSSGTTAQGNLIGTDASGTAALGNGSDGIFFAGGADNLVGGTTAAARNVISGNNGDGIDINGTPSTGNVVQGNYIGTDVTGTQALGNAQDGVAIFQAQNNTIGGTAPGAGNVISGNGGRGVAVSANNTTIQGNDIGTDASGAVALGNAADGVAILNASGALLGGTTAAAANIISANGGSGVLVNGAGAVSNFIEGNIIGTDGSGTTNLGNGVDGVTVRSGSNNTIGGTVPGAGNTIAFNGHDGVLVDTGAGNAILSDLIFSSGNLGIELVNNGNANQAAPQLTSASENGSNTVIQGTLSGTPNTTFTLQFFADPAPDASGKGEGRTLLGTLTVTTDGSGFASFTFTASQVVPPGQVVTATATNANTQNTSEFSDPIAVTGP
jgi:titin